MSSMPAEGDDQDLGPVEYARLLDHLPAMVAFWDQDGRNRFANAVYLDWFDVDPDEIRGQHISEVMGPEQFDLSEAYIDLVLAGEPQLLQRRVPDKFGNQRYLQLSYVPNLSEHGQDGFYVLGTEVSARVQAEEALQETVRQVALLEERQRIAADLHDLVIQRLFAVGLELGALQREQPDLSSRVSSAAIGVDEAIRELRLAIHSLRQLMSPTQVPSSVERILGNAARMLGFAPTMTYTGSLDDVPADVVQDLLAVLNEALSNVARHAEAGAVDVTIACAEGRLLLVVADDGRGIPHTERSSGLSNMRQRAERHGGSFLSRQNEPLGTVIEWMVPTGGS